MRLIKSLVGAEGFGRGEDEQYVPAGHEIDENGNAAAAVYLVPDDLAVELLGFTERWAPSDRELDTEGAAAMVQLHEKEKAERQASGKSDTEDASSEELNESAEDSSLEDEAIANAEAAGGPEQETEAKAPRKSRKKPE